MNKRDFLWSGALAAAALPAVAKPKTGAAGSSRSPVLTLSGAIGRSNRGPVDPALDQLVVKHKFGFTRAFELSSAVLAELDGVSISPTLEYDGKVHRLHGPLLSTVLEAAGVKLSAVREMTLHAVDGYTVPLAVEEMDAWKMMVALRLDGKPMGLGGLGPQWAMYDADRLDDFKDKPLKDRFAKCPWGLYHIEIG